MLASEQFIDSEDETLEGLFEGDGDADADADADADDEPLQGDEVTEDGEEESVTEDDEDDEEDDDEDEEEEEEEEDEEPSFDPGLPERPPVKSPSLPPSALSPPQKRVLSAAQSRRNAFLFHLDKPLPRTYAVEAISALPHPVPTHALASSACLSHLLTGSDDGYIRDYDIYSSVNSKNFLSAPQRHHAGVVEGLMKAGQLRCWWENPCLPEQQAHKLNKLEEETGLAPVYSLAMHPDALWSLAGTNAGHVNLFTLRHEPGRLCHVMNGHRGPVSALALDYDDNGFFSAGWDGEAIQWDLNTGQNVRNFTAHGAQLAAIAVRPISTSYRQQAPAVATLASQDSSVSTKKSQTASSDTTTLETDTKESQYSPMAIDSRTQDSNLQDSNLQPMVVESDVRSDTSFDPLFDDVPEETPLPQSTIPTESKLAMPGGTLPQTPLSQTPLPQTPLPQPRPTTTFIPPPKNAPPLLDFDSYSTYSPELLLTASIDGQVILWDRRVQTSGTGVGRLWMSEKTPPWCLSACWSADGAQIYAGRRNGTVDVWDARILGKSGPSSTPRLLKTLRNPTSSGVVSCVVAFPDCRHIASASVDNLRLWNVADSVEDAWRKPKSGVQFKIIPGHHGGYISQMLVDPGCKFLISASSNRGWHGDSTRTVFVHEIKNVD